MTVSTLQSSTVGLLYHLRVLDWAQYSACPDWPYGPDQSTFSAHTARNIHEARPAHSGAGPACAAHRARLAYVLHTAHIVPDWHAQACSTHEASPGHRLHAAPRGPGQGPDWHMCCMQHPCQTALCARSSVWGLSAGLI